jgi:hypothetical protein
MTYCYPIRGLDRSWGFQEFEAPRFQENRHMKLVRLSALRTDRLVPPSPPEIISGTHFCWGTRWRSWLRHCVTSRKVAVSFSDNIIRIFHWHNLSGRSMTMGSTQPLTEISKGKGKAIPLQAWTDTEVSRRLRLPDFKKIGTWKW